MPTYGPQMAAFRDWQPSSNRDFFEKMAEGTDTYARQHQATQSNYANYVNGIMANDTLDPVEKQRRLDGLRDKIHGTYSKYDGNIAEASDDIMNTIVENRKDPYWTADTNRTKAYRDLMTENQKLASQGLTPLYQDANGNYINDIKDVYSSLTDEYGNYKPMSAYNVMATKQMDYEKPFHEMFNTIKASVSSLAPSAKIPTDSEMAQLIKGYFTTGQIASPNGTINKVLKDALDRYQLTPEYNQMKGRWGDSAAREQASQLADAVANQYRYSQTKMDYSPIKYSEAEMKAKYEKPTESPITALEQPITNPVEPVKSTNLDYKKYPTIAKAIENKELNNTTLSIYEMARNLDVTQYAGYVLDLFGTTANTVLPKKWEFDSDYFKNAASKLMGNNAKDMAKEIINNSVDKPENMSDNEFATYKQTLASELEGVWKEAGYDAKDLLKEAKTVGIVKDNLSWESNGESKDIPAEQAVAQYNEYAANALNDIIYTTSESKYQFKGAEDILRDPEGRDLSNRVIRKKDSDGNWIVVKNTKYGDIAAVHAKPKGPHDITIDPKLGLGIISKTGGEEVFIHLDTKSKAKVEAIKTLKNAKQELYRNPEKRYVYSRDELGNPSLLIKHKGSPAYYDLAAYKNKSDEEIQKRIETLVANSENINTFMQRLDTEYKEANAYVYNSFEAKALEKLIATEATGNAQN